MVLVNIHPFHTRREVHGVVCFPGRMLDAGIDGEKWFPSAMSLSLEAVP